MIESVDALLRRGLVGVFSVALCGSLLCGEAAAQSTVVLNQPGRQVTDTTIRSGASADTNFDGESLITRRSASDADWERRAILKFDTHHFIPRGAQIASATLTLTVKSGRGAAGDTRPLQAFRISEPFQQAEATWHTRQGSSSWDTPGGDVAEQFASGEAGNAPGSKVTFDLTALVQRTSDGDFDSRYTRVLLADAAPEGKESYREYYSSEEDDASRRPTLTVALTSRRAAPPPPPPSPTPPSPTPPSGGRTLKVLQWNIAQGHGQDGKSNIDRVVDFIVKKTPDVISFNEIMHHSSGSHAKTIADKLRARTGQTWTYKWVQKSGRSSGEGECVMTRLDVEATDDYLLTVSRSVAMVRVNVNGRNVNIFSTHLDHRSSATRVAQVKQLVAWTDNHAEQRIMAGDFNGWPGTTEINEALKTQKDGWAIARSKGAAVSFPGNPDGNTRNTRIDYVFYSKGAADLAVIRAEVFDTRDASGKKPSDHNPLIVTFRVE
jgi:endonuclease/exonuclease/phosphatase family metal-dependent hydrolase